jgi:hypothetical protein
MSSSHCAHCGAMSTIWLPTCVFCGNSLSGLGSAPRSAPELRTRSVRQLAVADPKELSAPVVNGKEQARKCSSRIRGTRTEGGFLDALWSWWVRLFRSFARV